MPGGRFIDWLALVLLLIIQKRTHAWAESNSSAVTLPGWRDSEYITQCSFGSDGDLGGWTMSHHETDDGFSNMIKSGPLSPTTACLEFWYFYSVTANVSGLRALLYTSSGPYVLWTSPAVALEAWRLAMVPMTVTEPGTEVVLEAVLDESNSSSVTFDRIGIRSGVCGQQCESNAEFRTDLSTRCLCYGGQLYCFRSQSADGEIFQSDTGTIYRGKRGSAFNGEVFRLAQPCTYIQVKSCGRENPAFRVEAVVDAQEKTSATSVQQVVVYTGSDKISLHRNETQQAVVNGMSRKLPLSLHSGATMVTSNQAALQMRTSFGLLLTYDVTGSVDVTVLPTQSNKVCGLYGPREDDIMDGSDVSWDRPGGFHECKRDPVPNQCDPLAQALYASVLYCGAIKSKTGPFAACRPLLAVESHFRDCVAEMCSAHGDPRVMCEAFRNYADVCQEAGIPALTWRNSTLCGLINPATISPPAPSRPQDAFITPPQTPKATHHQTASLQPSQETEVKPQLTPSVTAARTQAPNDFDTTFFRRRRTTYRAHSSISNEIHFSTKPDPFTSTSVHPSSTNEPQHASVAGPLAQRTVPPTTSTESPATTEENRGKKRFTTVAAKPFTPFGSTTSEKLASTPPSTSSVPTEVVITDMWSPSSEAQQPTEPKFPSQTTGKPTSVGAVATKEQRKVSSEPYISTPAGYQPSIRAEATSKPHVGSTLRQKASTSARAAADITTPPHQTQVTIASSQLSIEGTSTIEGLTTKPASVTSLRSLTDSPEDPRRLPVTDEIQQSSSLKPLPPKETQTSPALQADSSATTVVPPPIHSQASTRRQSGRPHTPANTELLAHTTADLQADDEIQQPSTEFATGKPSQPGRPLRPHPSKATPAVAEQSTESRAQKHSTQAPETSNPTGSTASQATTARIQNQSTTLTTVKSASGQTTSEDRIYYSTLSDPTSLLRPHAGISTAAKHPPFTGRTTRRPKPLRPSEPKTVFASTPVMSNQEPTKETTAATTYSQTESHHVLLTRPQTTIPQTETATEQNGKTLRQTEGSVPHQQAPSTTPPQPSTQARGKLPQPTSSVIEPPTQPLTLANYKTPTDADTANTDGLLKTTFGSRNLPRTQMSNRPPRTTQILSTIRHFPRTTHSQPPTTAQWRVKADTSNPAEPDMTTPLASVHTVKPDPNTGTRLPCHTTARSLPETSVGEQSAQHPVTTRTRWPCTSRGQHTTTTTQVATRLSRTPEQQDLSKTCPRNSHYTTCMPACIPSCAKLNGPRHCSAGRGHCEAGCVCDDGFVQKRNKCVPVRQCGCVDPAGNKYQFREKWLSDHCTAKCQCKNRRGRGLVSCKETKCQRNSICLSSDNRGRCQKTDFRECVVFRGVFCKTFDEMINYVKGEQGQVLVQTEHLAPELPHVYIEEISNDQGSSKTEDYSSLQGRPGREGRRSEGNDDSDWSSSDEDKSDDGESKGKHDSQLKSKLKDHEKDENDSDGSKSGDEKQLREPDQSHGDEVKSDDREMCGEHFREDDCRRDESKSRSSQNKGGDSRKSRENKKDESDGRGSDEDSEEDERTDGDGSQSKDGRKDDSGEGSREKGVSEDSKEDERQGDDDDDDDDDDDNDEDRSGSDGSKSNDGEKEEEHFQEEDDFDVRSSSESKSKDSKDEKRPREDRRKSGVGRGPKRFKVRELTIRVFNHTVQFRGVLVLLVDGVITRIPASPSLGLDIRRSKAKMYLETDFGLSVEFSPLSTVITLPSMYMGKVEGLCGTFQFRTRNDRMKPGGKIMKDVQEFRERWKHGQGVRWRGVQFPLMPSATFGNQNEEQ